KGAEDQRAAFILARSNEFLGDEIHSVMQRRDHAERRGAEKACDFFVRMVFSEKHERFPSRGLKARVDAFGFAADFGQEILVALDVRAAGSPDLHESAALQVGGVLLRKSIES